MIIALGCGPATARPIADWQFVYPSSGNRERDCVYTSGERLYYVRTALRRAPGALPALSTWMRVDNIRRVTANETTAEIDGKNQRALAERAARRIEALQYDDYLPMQNRAKIPLKSSSFASSPVR